MILKQRIIMIYSLYSLYFLINLAYLIFGIVIFSDFDISTNTQCPNLIVHNVISIGTVLGITLMVEIAIDMYWKQIVRENIMMWTIAFGLAVEILSPAIAVLLYLEKIVTIFSQHVMILYDVYHWYDVVNDLQNSLRETRCIIISHDYTNL